MKDHYLLMRQNAFFQVLLEEARGEDIPDDLKDILPATQSPNDRSLNILQDGITIIEKSNIELSAEQRSELIDMLGKRESDRFIQAGGFLAGIALGLAEPMQYSLQNATRSSGNISSSLSNDDDTFTTSSASTPPLEAMAPLGRRHMPNQKSTDFDIHKILLSEEEARSMQEVGCKGVHVMVPMLITDPEQQARVDAEVERFVFGASLEEVATLGQTPNTSPRSTRSSLDTGSNRTSNDSASSSLTSDGEDFAPTQIVQSTKRPLNRDTAIYKTEENPRTPEPPKPSWRGALEAERSSRTESKSL